MSMATICRRAVYGAALVVLLGVSSLRAEDVPPFPDHSGGLLTTEALIEAGREVTPEKFPNADTVQVDKHVFVRYREDGTYVQWDDDCTKILTEKGRRALQTLGSWYTIPYNTTEFKRLEIIKPDGKVIPIDVAKLSRDVADSSQMQKNITNPNDRIVQVSLPGLEIGDMVRFVLFDNFVKARVPGTFSDFLIFESTQPIRRSVFEVQGPKSLPLRSIALKAEIPGTVAHAQSEQGGLLQYRWEARDVPQMYPEPQMPPLHTVVQRLIVSTIPDWQTISRWYWNLSKPHLDPTPAMRETVQQIVAGAADRQQKIDRIFRWVSQNVRYVGITIEDNAPGYEPHDVSMTFEKRHGVCRDKAALLVAMLRLADLEAFPVLIHNGPKKDEEVPAPFFNHAVVAVREPDKTFQLMDPTDESTKRLFPAYLGNQSYLVATPEGDPLRTSPVVPAEENLMRIATRGRIDASGTLKAETTLDFDGINDNAYRGYFSQVKPEERRRLFEGRIKNAVPGARLTGYSLTPADMQDTSQHIAVRLQWEAPEAVVRSRLHAMLPLPRLSGDFGMANFAFGQTGLEKRKYPMLLDSACGIEERFDIAIDPAAGSILSLPQYEPIDNEQLHLGAQLAMNEGKTALTGASRYLIKAVEWTPEQYLMLKQTLQKAEYALRKMPILSSRTAETVAPEGADVLVLSSDVRYDVESLNAWTETRTSRQRVLTYAGKKDASDLKIPFNPAWEEVKLENVKVRQADGTEHLIGEKEINIMDAAWVGAAPRYPAGKILVANLPGVEVGSEIEYSLVRRSFGKPFFSLQESFRGSDPLQTKTVTISAPASLPLETLLRRDESGATPIQPIDRTRAVEDNRVTMTWTVRDPGFVKSEDRLPPWWTFNPTLLASTTNWQAYAQEILAVLQKNSAERAAVAERTKAVTAGAKDDAAKVQAIRDFVALNVREAGPGFGSLPLSALSAADRTLEDGYGNTADRAVLLHAMLETAGLTPSFVLASYLPYLDEPERKVIEQAPDPTWFGSLLVAVPVDGQTIYLNDTNQYHALGAVASADRLGLPLAQPELIAIQPPADRTDRQSVDYAVTVDAFGRAEIDRTEELTGTTFGETKQFFTELPPEELKRWQQEAVARISQSARFTGRFDTDFDEYPGSLTYGASIESFAVVDGDYLYFDVPESLAGALRLRSDSRESPVWFGSAQRLQVRYRIDLPEGYELLMQPRPFAMTLPGRWNASVESSVDPEGRLQVRYALDLAPGLVPATLYDELQEVHRAFAHAQSRTVLLKKKP